MTKDHVFLQADKFIDLTSKSRFGQNLGGFLEAGCRDERLGLNGGLRDTQKLGGTAGWPWPCPFSLTCTFDLDPLIFCITDIARNDFVFLKLGIARIFDLDAVGQLDVRATKLEFIDH